MHTILSFLAALEGHPTIAALPFSTLLTFLRCAHRLKDDILQPQPHSISIDAAPEVLPPAITHFFASFLGIPIDTVAVLWSAVGNVVWSLPLPEEADALEEDAFRRYGHSHGISKSCRPPQSPPLTFTLSSPTHILSSH